MWINKRNISNKATNVTKTETTDDNIYVQDFSINKRNISNKITKINAIKFDKTRTTDDEDKKFSRTVAKRLKTLITSFYLMNQ